MVRLVIAVLLSATLSAMTCAISPPCYAVRPSLVVAIAEAMDSYEAPSQLKSHETRVPIRMRLRQLIYGPSPGTEFTLSWFAESGIRAGEWIYIEESNAPLRATGCGHTGETLASSASRQKFFHELAAGKHQETYLSVGLRVAPNSAIRLSGANGVTERHTDARGLAEWRGLPPGRYTIHPARAAHHPDVQLFPGACRQILFDPK